MQLASGLDELYKLAIPRLEVHCRDNGLLLKLFNIDNKFLCIIELKALFVKYGKYEWTYI